MAGIKPQSRLVCLFVVTALLVAGEAIVGAASCSAASAGFIAPVDARIVRHFEQPLGPFSAGHRGVDFDVSAGTPVVASNDGRVTFAGPVADDGLFVTIAHQGNLETTYSFLSAIDVAVGQAVSRGDRIGASGAGHPGADQPSLHFGVRFAKAYIDPELVLFRDLKDVSDAISLGPLPKGEAPIEVVHGGSNGLSMHGRSNQRSASGGVVAAESRESIPVRVGSWIGKTFSAIGGFVGGAISSVGSIASSAAKGAVEAGGYVARAGSAVGRGVVGGLKKVWRFDVSIGRAFRRFIVGRGRRTRRAVARLDRLAGRMMRYSTLQADMAKFLLKFVRAMTKGAVKQVGCSIHGGAKPPHIPTAEEFASGRRIPAPNQNIVVAIPGISSSTPLRPDKNIDRAEPIIGIDFRRLGYAEDKIFNYSYKGVADNGGGGPYRLHAKYTAEDTYKSIRDSAQLLSDEIDSIHEKFPDQRIDLVAHSQGGLVAEAYLTNFYRRGSLTSPKVDHLVTFSTPHLGADAAALAPLLSDSPSGRRILKRIDGIADRYALPKPSSTSAREMWENSSFLRELSASWSPGETKVTTVGASFDFVVPPQRTLLPGAKHYTASLSARASLSAHSGILAAPESQSILYAALSNAPAACTQFRDAFADSGSGPLISSVETDLIRSVDDFTEVH
ncbi:MAG: peptidoglycan DD-metalloendopeptidase family protein [Actinobacteria bacterium]|nr:peptidoglycan DD-metalloendopeptidase family protein [Actinomycetota bacterium]